MDTLSYPQSEFEKSERRRVLSASLAFRGNPARGNKKHRIFAPEKETKTITITS